MDPCISVERWRHVLSMESDLGLEYAGLLGKLGMCVSLPGSSFFSMKSSHSDKKI